MYSTVLKEIEALHAAPIAAIRKRYREVFAEEPRSNHRENLFRRLAWRLQSLAQGGLSERARQRAAEIANEADLRIRPPRDRDPLRIVANNRRDARIPTIGSTLTRTFRGSIISVKVQPNGFEYQGKTYRSLSAIAVEVTGTRWNGLAFFGLTGTRKQRKGSRHAGNE